MPLPYEDWICGYCGEGHGLVLGDIEERYSLGIYAGRYHTQCWDRSGYRKEGAGGFHPDDAGESYEEI